MNPRFMRRIVSASLAVIGLAGATSGVASHTTLSQPARHSAMYHVPSPSGGLAMHDPIAGAVRPVMFYACAPSAMFHATDPISQLAMFHAPAPSTQLATDYFSASSAQSAVPCSRSAPGVVHDASSSVRLTMFYTDKPGMSYGGEPAMFHTGKPLAVELAMYYDGPSLPPRNMHFV